MPSQHSQRQEDDILLILRTPITTFLPATDTSPILASPPFVSIPGSFNVRSLSSHPSFPTAVAPNLAFRSGSLENLTSEGHAALQALNIKTIFDLRSLVERSGFPAPEIKGVDVIWTPSTLGNETTAAAQGHKKDEAKQFSLIDMYIDILSSHADAFRIVLKHVAEHPNQPFLFHCTAGKDRTGVLAFLLESLAGSDVQAMNVEYALTRVGIEPVRDFLLKKLLGGKEMSAEEVEKVLASQRMKAYAEIPLDLMGKLEKAVDEKWGGVDLYVKEELGLAESVIEAVKKNLRA